MMRAFHPFLVLTLTVAVLGCGERAVSEAPVAGVSPEDPIAASISSPSGPGAGEPFLATGEDGSLLMSWLEPTVDGAHALRFARYDGSTWSEPVTVVERDDFFVNWADFPSIVETSSGLLAHWLQKSGEGPYAYDVMIARSTDGGVNWAPSEVLHTDGVEAEHGFVSLVPEDGGSDAIGALWLDGRNMAEGAHGEGAGAMTLRFARIHPDGTVTDRQELDDRVCECCQTSMTMTDTGFVAVYRDRSENEIRDIGVVRQVGESWTEPAIVHDDGWEIAACPVNGPQIDASDDTVAVAWYTEAEDSGRVMVAFSENGAPFGEAIRVDEGGAIGRVDTLMIGEGSALVVWLGEEGEVLSRIVEVDGTVSEVHAIGRSSSSRASGFPRITKANGVVYVAWTEPEGTSTIRLASIDLEETA